MKRVTELEPRATRLSNTLGVTAIGTGSAGSFNYAAQQKLERKREPVAKKDRTASGSVLAGAGAVTAGIGLVGGGIPGLKGDARMVANIHKPGAAGIGAKLAAGRGGIFGARTVAHQGKTAEFQHDTDYFADKPATGPDVRARHDRREDPPRAPGHPAPEGGPAGVHRPAGRWAG